MKAFIKSKWLTEEFEEFRKQHNKKWRHDYNAEKKDREMKDMIQMKRIALLRTS